MLISLIVPCYNEEEAMPLFYREASRVAEEMKQLLRSLKQDRIIIFSTHIMDLALDLCDEIVLLSHGELEIVDKSDLDSKEFKEKIIAALREEAND